MKGSLSCEKVFFAYPTRPNVNVANGLNLTARPGQTIALVGPSGGGKSTIINLLQRFYEPKSGDLVSAAGGAGEEHEQKLDGNSIHDFKLSHLRSQMALVGQEPVLFSGSVLDNVTLGVPGVAREEVLDALRIANAADFVEKLPQVG